MAKLYFKYGAMGSSKTANALMCRFNYIDKHYNVLLWKSSIDTRFENGGKAMVTSRIGLSAPCTKFGTETDLTELYAKQKTTEEKDVIIVDECQFLTPKQVEELKLLSHNLPVICYGLLTNFKTELFAGSKRLVELADSIQEIKSVCRCGRKATVNARFVNGKIATSGAEIEIGADEKYEGMCYWCYQEKLKEN